MSFLRRSPISCHSLIVLFAMIILVNPASSAKWKWETKEALAGLTEEEKRCQGKQEVVVAQFFWGMMNANKELVHDSPCIDTMKKFWFRSTWWGELSEMKSLKKKESVGRLATLLKVNGKDDLKPLDPEALEAAAVFLFFKSQEDGSITGMNTAKKFFVVNKSLTSWVETMSKGELKKGENRKDKDLELVTELKKITDKLSAAHLSIGSTPVQIAFDYNSARLFKLHNLIPQDKVEDRPPSPAEAPQNKVGKKSKLPRSPELKQSIDHANVAKERRMKKRQPSGEAKVEPCSLC